MDRACWWYVVGLLSATLCLGQSEGVEELSLARGVPDLPPAETIHKDVHEVNLLFTARDSSGRFRTDLTLEDLDIQDDGRPAEKVSRFEAQTQLPLKVVLLIDTSDSITKKFKAEKLAALTFLEQVLRPEVDQVMIASFSNRATPVTGFTGDMGTLRNAIEELKPGGGTAFYDAITFSVTELNRRNGGPRRQILIVISDGQENASQAAEKHALAAVMRSNALIFALSTKGEFVSSPSSRGPDETGYFLLRKFAKVTGGTIWSAGNQRQLSKAFANIQQEIRSQYFLAYKPAEFVADGRYRRIKLRGNGRHLHFYAREGYYTLGPAYDP